MVKKRESLRLKMRRKGEEMSDLKKQRILRRKLKQVERLVEKSKDRRRKQIKKKRAESAKKEKKGGSKVRAKKTPAKRASRAKAETQRGSKTAKKKRVVKKEKTVVVEKKAVRARSRPQRRTTKGRKSCQKRVKSRGVRTRRGKAKEEKVKDIAKLGEEKKSVGEEYEELECSELVANIRKVEASKGKKRVSKRIQKKRKQTGGKKSAKGKRGSRKKKMEMVKEIKKRKVERAKKVKAKQTSLKKKGKQTPKSKVKAKGSKKIGKKSTSKKIGKKSVSKKIGKKSASKILRDKRNKAKRGPKETPKRRGPTQQRKSGKKESKLGESNKKTQMIAKEVETCEANRKSDTKPDQNEQSEDSEYESFKYTNRTPTNLNIFNGLDKTTEDPFSPALKLGQKLAQRFKTLSPKKNIANESIEEEESEEEFGILDVLDLMPKCTKKMRTSSKKEVPAGVESSGNYMGVCEELISEPEEESEMEDELVDDNVNLLGFNDLLKTYHGVDVKESNTDDEESESEMEVEGDTGQMDRSGEKSGKGTVMVGAFEKTLFSGHVNVPRERSQDKERSGRRESEVNHFSTAKESHVTSVPEKDIQQLMGSSGLGATYIKDTRVSQDQSEEQSLESCIETEGRVIDKQEHTLEDASKELAEEEDKENEDSEDETSHKIEEERESGLESDVVTRNGEELMPPIRENKGVSNRKSSSATLETPGNQKITDSNLSTDIRNPQTPEQEENFISVFKDQSVVKPDLVSEKFPEMESNLDLSAGKTVFSGKALEFEQESSKKDSGFKLKRKRKKSREFVEAETVRVKSKFIRENFTSQGKVKRQIPENVHKLFEPSSQVSDLGFKERGGKRCGPEEEDIIRVDSSEIEEEKEDCENQSQPVQKIEEERAEPEESQEIVEEESEVQTHLEVKIPRPEKIEEETCDPVSNGIQNKISKMEPACVRPSAQPYVSRMRKMPQMKSRSDVSKLISQLRQKKKAVPKTPRNFCKMSKVGFREKFQDLLAGHSRFSLSSDFNRLLTKFKMTNVLLNLFARKGITPFWSDISSNMVATYRLKVDHSDLSRMMKLLPGCFEVEWALNERINDHDLVLYFPQMSAAHMGKSGEGKSHLQASRAWQVHLLQQKLKGQNKNLNGSSLHGNMDLGVKENAPKNGQQMSGKRRTNCTLSSAQMKRRIELFRQRLVQFGGIIHSHFLRSKNLSGRSFSGEYLKSWHFKFEFENELRLNKLPTGTLPPKPETKDLVARQREQLDHILERNRKSEVQVLERRIEALREEAKQQILNKSKEGLFSEFEKRSFPLKVAERASVASTGLSSRMSESVRKCETVGSAMGSSETASKNYIKNTLKWKTRLAKAHGDRKHFVEEEGMTLGEKQQRKFQGVYNKIQTMIRKKESLLEAERKKMAAERGSVAFNKKFILDNKKETLALVRFLHTYTMTKKVQNVFVVQAIERLKKISRFVYFRKSDLLEKIKRVCHVFPDYLQLKDFENGLILRVNRSIKLGQIVKRVNGL